MRTHTLTQTGALNIIKPKKINETVHGKQHNTIAYSSRASRFVVMQNDHPSNQQKKKNRNAYNVQLSGCIVLVVVSVAPPPGWLVLRSVSAISVPRLQQLATLVLRLAGRLDLGGRIALVRRHVPDQIVENLRKGVGWCFVGQHYNAINGGVEVTGSGYNWVQSGW